MLGPWIGLSFICFISGALLLADVYKAYHNIEPVYMENLFSKIDPFHSTTRRKKPLEQPSISTVTYRCNSFMYQGAKKWNLLSSTFKEAVSVEDFKVMIRTGNGNVVLKQIKANCPNIGRWSALLVILTQSPFQ